MSNVLALSVLTAAAIGTPESKTELIEEVERIAKGQTVPEQLSGEMLILASTIVQVCVVVVETSKLIHGFFHRSHEQRLAEVLARIEAKTSDPSVRSDQQITHIADPALKALDADHSKTDK